MALECELKYLDVDLENLGRQLEKVGSLMAEPYFESNTVFDYPDRSLKAKGILLRLRHKQGESVLTVKRPPSVKSESHLKVFEELETGVVNGEVLGQVLEAVGFTVAFVYEKVREKWRYMNCTLCLDRLPFGDYVEIEGDESDVMACARELGLDTYQTTKETYHALNLAYRAENGLKPDESFTLADDVKADILGKTR